MAVKIYVHQKETGNKWRVAGVICEKCDHDNPVAGAEVVDPLIEPLKDFLKGHLTSLAAYESVVRTWSPRIADDLRADRHTLRSALENL